MGRLQPNGRNQVRAALEERGIDHVGLSDRDAVNLHYALKGWHVVPKTPAGSGPIAARVWLAAALNTRGRYEAPEAFGHAADLHDGQGLVDSIVLMAVLQRHLLPAPQPAWEDETLAQQLGVPADHITRAQRVLDDAAELLLRPAASGAAWWLSPVERDRGDNVGGDEGRTTNDRHGDL